MRSLDWLNLLLLTFLNNEPAKRIAHVSQSPFDLFTNQSANGTVVAIVWKILQSNKQYIGVGHSGAGKFENVSTLHLLTVE